MVQTAVASGQVPPKAKKPKGKRPVRVNYYLPADLVTRVDAYGEKLQAEDKLHRPVTRTDAIRALIEVALKTEGVE